MMMMKTLKHDFGATSLKFFLIKTGLFSGQSRDAKAVLCGTYNNNRVFG